MSKGSALSRAVRFFREADHDEARAAFTIVKEVMDARVAQVKSQEKAAERSRPKRHRRTKEEIAKGASVPPPPGSQERVAAGG